MLTIDEVPLSQSALLVIDAQDSFKVDPKWERRNNRNFERHVAALIDAHRAAGLPVFFFLHTVALEARIAVGVQEEEHRKAGGDPGFERDGPYLRLMDFIRVNPGEPVMLKDTRNAFTSTTLQAQLLALGVRRLAITGIQMEQCCETTARVAADLGYAVDFVIDATMTFPIRNWDVPGDELGVEDVEERTVYALRKRFARIVTTATLVGELEALATSLPEPAFST